MDCRDHGRSNYLLAPTVRRSELTPGGDDQALRSLLHNLLGFADRHVSIRNGFAERLGITGGQYTILPGVACLQGCGATTVQAVAGHLHSDPAYVEVETNRLVNGGFLD